LPKRVAIALYALGSSSEYRVIGRLFGVSKSIVGEILKEFCAEVWSKMAPVFLSPDFLYNERIVECVKGFEKIGMPQSLGAVGELYN